ncbi:response regulator [Heyndrickxia oleronia]|uniref:response regulator transcription factor n=1 Tax=Heyndrickxia oleronia TaxID=38875 RepID=UPI00203ADF83|nr:response regulator [Heyndrickxia oleronia]MCM3452386.1 response regulator [Heyndrickxia oleronia]
MKVLIIDDEYLELEQLTFLINQRYPSWDLVTAEDAAAAKKFLKKDNYQLALIDIHIPGENGLDLCAYIKENYDTECIMITAFQDFNYARQSIKLHVIDYLIKPIIAKELYQTLDQFLESIGGNKLSSDIQEVLHIIHQQYNKKLSLPHLAEHIHVSPTYLSKKFKEEKKENFQEYLVRYRVEKAKELIKSAPHLPMGIIAERTGFSSQNHLSSSFKKITHLSPSEYKDALGNV